VATLLFTKKNPEINPRSLEGTPRSREGATMIIKNQIPILKKLEFITFDSLIYHFKSMFMSILDKKSPFEYLFNLKSDYSFLKIFHCLYFFLWIYNRHKINFHSLNVFLLAIIPLVLIINVSIFLHERFMWLGISIFMKLFSHLHMLIRSKVIFSIFSCPMITTLLLVSQPTYHKQLVIISQPLPTSTTTLSNHLLNDYQTFELYVSFLSNNYLNLCQHLPHHFLIHYLVITKNLNFRQVSCQRTISIKKIKLFRWDFNI
jgi:hypothetical protein